MASLFRVALLGLCYGSHWATARIARRANGSDVLDWVNPLIGSREGGNVFAGATLPYGMAKGRSR